MPDPDPEISGVLGLQKPFFGPSGLWSKNKGGGPPLDPPPLME